MEEESSYFVEITPEAELYYLSLLEYLSNTHSPESTSKKGDEILAMAISLDNNPNRGSVEDKLAFLNKDHRYLLHEITKRKHVKIICFVDQENSMV